MYKKFGKFFVGMLVSFGLILSGGIAANAEEDNLSDTLFKVIDIGLVSREGEVTTFDWLLEKPDVNNKIAYYELRCGGSYGNNLPYYSTGKSVGAEKKASCLIPDDFWGNITVSSYDKDNKNIGGSEFIRYMPANNPTPAGTLGKLTWITSIRPVSTSITDRNELLVTWQKPIQEDIKNPTTNFIIKLVRVTSGTQVIQEEKILKVVSAEDTKAIIEVDGYAKEYRIGVLAKKLIGTEGSYAYLYTPPQDYYTPCPDVQLIAARGSDEPLQDDDGTVIKGSEEQTLLTNEQIAEELPGYIGIINGGVETVYAQNLKQEITKKINPETDKPYTVDTYAVPYPAVKPVFGDAFDWSTDQFWVNNIVFGQSVNAGSEMTSNKIEKVRNICPNTKIVLSGYSQGALAVAQATDALGKKDIHVDSIALFGDPFFNPADTVADRSNYNKEYSGMLNTREAWMQVTSAPVNSFCHDLDVFCNITKNGTKDVAIPLLAAMTNNGNMYAPHESYPEVWAADNTQATLEAAKQTVKDLKL